MQRYQITGQLILQLYFSLLRFYAKINSEMKIKMNTIKLEEFIYPIDSDLKIFLLRAALSFNFDK
jgi:hypothetical protein